MAKLYVFLGRYVPGDFFGNKQDQISLFLLIDDVDVGQSDRYETFTQTCVKNLPEIPWVPVLDMSTWEFSDLYELWEPFHVMLIFFEYIREPWFTLGFT